MRKLQTKLLILFVLIIILQSIKITNSKYMKSFIKEYRGSIAEPIIELENYDSIEKLVNKFDFPMEYIFKIKNFNENQEINEVDFLYNIEPIFSNNNFPVKWKIVDESKNEIITNETFFKLSKGHKEEKIYKLILEWDDKDIELSKDFDMKIKVNLKQYKIGEFKSE